MQPNTGKWERLLQRTSFHDRWIYFGCYQYSEYGGIYWWFRQRTKTAKENFFYRLFLTLTFFILISWGHRLPPQISRRCQNYPPLKSHMSTAMSLSVARVYCAVDMLPIYTEYALYFIDIHAFAMMNETIIWIWWMKCTEYMHQVFDLFK